MACCSKCGIKVEEGTNFCTSCGKELKNNLMVTDNEKLSLLQNDNLNDSSKKKKTKLMAFIAAAVLIIFAAVIFGKNLYIRHNPVNWLLYSLNENLTKDFTKGEACEVTIKNETKTSTVDCKELILNLHNDKITKLVQNLSAKISEDKNAKEFVKEKMDHFIAIAEKNGDLKKMNVNQANVDKEKKDFDINYDKAMNNLKTQSNNYIYNKNNPSTFKYVFKIDSQNRIREINTSVQCKINKSASVNLTMNRVFTVIGGPVTINKVTKDTGIDISKLTQTDKENITAKVEENLKHIITSKFGL